MTLSSQYNNHLNIQMSVEDCQQDCTVYIQELKSDNPSLKLNAASKITFIAAALGHNRLKEELIPYIIQIIDEMDNDIEFLSKVAEQMAELKSYCKSISETYVLIEPLYKLASLDQPAVREKAIKSLEELAKDQNQGFFKDHYFPLIERMASEEATAHSSRVAVCGLIPICYPKVSADIQGELRVIFNRLGKDDSPMVRRSISEAVEAYADVVSKEVMRTEILELWQRFIQDIIDVVRVKALEIMPVMSRYFKKDEMPEKFVKYMKVVDNDKKSWRIRYSLIEAWANIMGCVDKAVIKKEIKESFEELLKDPEYEVRSIAILKLPLLCQNLPKQVVIDDLLPHLDRLSKDTVSAHVRQSVMEALPPILKYLSDEQANTIGISIIEALLKDEAIPVRIAVIERLKDITEVLGVQAAKKAIIPLITSHPQDNKWRYRVSIVEKFVELCKALGFDAFDDTIESLLKGFLRDHYYSVRQQAFKILGELAQGFGEKRGKTLITNIILELAKDKNFTFRVAACQAVAGCKNGFNERDLSELVSSLVRELKDEKIPNVLINLCKTYSIVKPSVNAQTRKEWNETLQRLKDSKDEDVVFYASKTE